MPLVETVGTICRTRGEQYERFDWKIANFFSHSGEFVHYYVSPPFDFALRSWELQFNPVATSKRKKISLSLSLMKPTNEVRVHFIIGFKKLDGSLEESFENFYSFKDGKLKCAFESGLRPSDILSRASELAPSDCLTVTVIMSTDLSRSLQGILPVKNEAAANSAKFVNEARQTEKEDILPGKNEAATNSAKFVNEARQTEKEGILPGKHEAAANSAKFVNEARQTEKEGILPGKNEAVATSAKFVNEARQTEKEDILSGKNEAAANSAKFVNEASQTENEGGQKVLKDMGKLLVSGENSDVTVQVGDAQFRAHEIILAARSPVLAAVFQDETAGKESNKIHITDCEPDVFEEFLHYIYTGNAREVTEQNAFALYRVADKYSADDLKSQCLVYIRDTLCVETVCSIVEFAMSYEETELLQLAIDFAVKNIRLLLYCEKWQKFFEEHTPAAREILMKSLRSPDVSGVKNGE